MQRLVADTRRAGRRVRGWSETDETESDGGDDTKAVIDGGSRQRTRGRVIANAFSGESTSGASPTGTAPSKAE